uniref:Uncharacterized protein n=1 Tax=Anopheles maculatus TaxID=74869 RepID=A0A182SQJ8_9DIPT
MSSRLCVVLFVSVAIVTVKGLPGAADGLWSKVASSSLQSSPARHLFANQQYARSFPDDQVVPVVKEDPKKVKVSVPIVPADEPKVKKLHEAFTAKQKKQPEVYVKTRSDKTESGEPRVPIFAKLILGDPAHPKLATVESLRKIDWRSVETFLELPNKQTMPLVNELLQKTEELLRLFQELQLESNGFVEDIEQHNENSAKEYIGYYN